MQNQTISDVIERYLKQILAQNQEVEVKRAALAALFDCVPSQINYVIKTRFPLEAGYVVESKRGGGGYIRITKVALVADASLYTALAAQIDRELTENQALAVLARLVEAKALERTEADLVAAMLSTRALSSLPAAARNRVRASQLLSLLDRLKYHNH